MKLGQFSDEAINAAKQLLSDSIEFSELETMDFARCQRADGSFYGTGGQCRKGKESGAKEVEPKKVKAKSVEEEKTEKKPKSVKEAVPKKEKKDPYTGSKAGLKRAMDIVNEGRKNEKYNEVVESMSKIAKGPLEKIIDSNGSIEDAMKELFKENGAWADFDGVAGQLIDDMSAGERKLGAEVQAVYSALGSYAYKNKDGAEDFVKGVVAKAGVKIAEERGWEGES